ncbi:MAG TPA: hypothetical protein VF484_00355 [Candidatus Limnocylindrales bacterium]
MKKRMGLGALLGAGALVFAMSGVAFATAPAPHVTVTKDAFPESVPADGGDVQFTVHVQNDGTGAADLHTVVVGDNMVGCTLSGPTGDDGDGILNVGETWDYTCTVTDVAPNTTNTATVNACKDSSPNCNSDKHDASGQGQVEVGLCEAECDVLPSSAPSEQPSAQPSQGGGGASNIPTQAPTDTSATGNAGPANSAWFLVVAFAVLLGSLYILRPATARRER